MAGLQAGKGSPGALVLGARGQRPGRSIQPQGRNWAPEHNLAGEASPGPVDFQARGPQVMVGWRKGATTAGPRRGQASRARSELSEHSTAWEFFLNPVPGALPPGGLEGEAQDRGSHPGLTRAPEPELAGEAFLGLVESQVWTPQVTAGWRKGAPVPGPGGGLGPS
ncbi:hypothetical protein NDU88_000628 [Pleurodeles waltl]|uniref:Uncharacterized protein n=1 Tax=Pleurodeles waltl TaxID=8319 RepID=A0AAV7UUL3_PLEWA|nr:hypothetical protein NDU88_000628 [Pleurodeles waltl]